MTNYDIEVGENENSSTCHCCGEESCVGHGFVYKNDDAHAVYYAGWSDAHLDKTVSVALAIGRWDDDSTTGDRTCFGIEVSGGQDEVLFRIIGPSESPWSNTDLLGQMLPRQKGLSNPLLHEAFAITENILRSHIALRKYLEIPEEKIKFSVKH